MNKKPSRIASKKEEKEKEVKVYHDDPTLVKQEVSVVLIYPDRPDNPDRENSYEELLPNQMLYVNPGGEIVLERLVDSLRGDSFLTEECGLSYEDPNRGCFIYCGYIKGADKSKESNENSVKEEYINIPVTFAKENQLKLKVRKSKKGLVECLLEEQKKNTDKEAVEEQKSAKQKQKKIGEVVEKVALWRRFYTGFYDQKGGYVQKPLQQAATEVGVAKKTLDDYLLQIRCGKKYGFNFNSSVNSKIGQLRAFVKDAKKKEGKD